MKKILLLITGLLILISLGCTMYTEQQGDNSGKSEVIDQEEGIILEKDSDTRASDEWKMEMLIYPSMYTSMNEYEKVIYNFDSINRASSRKFYKKSTKNGADWILNRKDVIYYDKSGKVSKIKEDHLSSHDTYDYICYYKYDNDGKLYHIDRIPSNPNNYESDYDITYNTQETIVRCRKSSPDRIQRSKKTITKIFLKQDPEYSYKIKVVENVKTTLKESRKSDVYTYKLEYFYDKDGKLVDEIFTIYEDDEKQFSENYTYIYSSKNKNDFGRCIDNKIYWKYNNVKTSNYDPIDPFNTFNINIGVVSMNMGLFNGDY